MSTVNNYFEHAELALAAYSKLTPGGPPDINDLYDDGKGLSLKQADHFAETYTVVDQYNAPAPNGLSATVFEDGDGNTYLAIRGTDGVNDYLTDLVDIALLGTTAFQAQYASLKAKVQKWLDDEVLKPSFTVTGHSSGGFLATGIVADFADKVSHAYLYNAPGLGGIVHPVTSPILDALGIASSHDPAKFSNLKAETGISPIAELGYQVSPSIRIVIEDQNSTDVTDPPFALNHDQQVLTDTLALYSVFSQLAPDITTSQIGAIVKAATHLNSVTLESSLDALRTILFGPNAAPTAVADRDIGTISIQNAIIS
jgi:pimeloyl-ACP methyl ester carboxylesterase